MRIAGVVAEYNPFHNGHAHHLEMTRAKGGCEATHIVAVMSSSFVQRGEPAVMTKFDRARAALAGGADLVIELPVPWSLSSAEGFAFGAVSLLEALGCVEFLSFGSEAGAIAPLEKAVKHMETERFSNLLKYYLGSGSPFPEAQQKALAEIAGSTAAAVLDTPNNTLGIEYIKALRRLGSAIAPFTVKRHGTAHDSLVPLGDIASASYLRRLMSEAQWVNALPFMPAPCASVLSEAASAARAPALVDGRDAAILARLRTMSAEELGAIAGVSEGLENRLYNAVRTAASLAELEESVKTKRYPLTRVRRLIMSAFLGIPAGYATRRPPYIRVLAANSRGKEILSAAKPSLPLLYRAAQVSKLDAEGQALWELETRATDLHALFCATPQPCGADFTTGLIRE